MTNISNTPSISGLFARATSLLAKCGTEVEGEDARIVTGQTPSFGEVDLIQDQQDRRVRLQETKSEAAFIEFEADGTSDTRSPRALETASKVLSELEAVQ